MKKMKKVKEMKFKMRFDAWKEIKIIIKDEEKFKESCEKFFEDEVRDIEWDDENRDEYEEIMREYISEIM